MKTATIILIIAIVMPYQAYGTVQRQFIDIGGTRQARVYVNCINDQGQVVGYTDDLNGSIYADSVFFYGNTGEPIPATGPGYASGINNVGQVVGSYGVPPKAFLHGSGQMTEVATLNGAKGTGIAINDSGDIAGNTLLRSFLSSGGTVTDLGALGSAGQTYAKDINNSKQIVGYSVVDGGANHAFLWSGGVMTDLGTLVGTASRAERINVLGQVVGSFTVASENREHAFLYSGGAMVDLTMSGWTTSEAHGINDLGQVVGEYSISHGSYDERYACLWSNGSAVVLDTLLGPENAGWHLLRAIDINNNGWITGDAIAPDGSVHAFILTPEPGTIAILAFGGVILRRVRGRIRESEK